MASAIQEGVGVVVVVGDKGGVDGSGWMAQFANSEQE